MYFDLGITKDFRICKIRPRCVIRIAQCLPYHANKRRTTMEIRTKPMQNGFKLDIAN